MAKWQWPERDLTRGHPIDPEALRAVTAFMDVLADHYPYIVEEMRLRWPQESGGLAGGLFYRGGPALGIIEDVMRDFPKESTTVAIELARQSPWAGLLLALVYPQRARPTQP